MKKVLLAALLALIFVFPAKAICPAAPALQSPSNNATVPFGNILLNWSDSPGATEYQLWVGVDGDPTSLIDTVTASQFVLEVEPGRTIQWKVGAAAPACPTMYAGYFFFTTSCPTAKPVLQEPDAGESFQPGQSITFDWTPTAGATSYDVIVTPDFGQTFETIAENVTASQFTTNDLPAGNWGWHVRVNFDGDCDPVFSNPSAFLISNCTRPAPQLTAPANNATVALPATFQWSNVNADHYELWMQREGSQAQAVDSNIELTVKVLNSMDPGTYSWWIVAKFTGCPDVVSSKRVIHIEGDGGCPTNPGKATLVSPAANATNLASPVTFDWNAVPGAQGYRVLAAFGNGEAESLGTTNANTTQLTVQLPNGSGAWVVQTFFGEDCPTTLSERRGFTVTQGTACPTTAPQLISPPNGTATVDSPVVFDWSDVPNAIGYALFVNTGGDDFSLYGTTDAGTTQLSRLIPEGAIDWFVVARFTGCPDVRSATFHFGTDTNCQLGPVQILTPAAGGEVDSPVTVSWNPVQNATLYRVTLKTANGAVALSSRTTNTSATLRLPAGTFNVQVEALREGCESSSAERQFTVKQGTNCANNAAPVLVSPAGTQSQPAQAQSPVTLTWNPVAGAIGYQIFAANGDEPFEDIGITTQTSDEVELEPGRYRWFVAAIFEGCDPKRSDVAFFVIPDTEGCTRQPPQVIAPANNATVDSPVTIDWNGVPGARKYRVLAIVNEKTTLLGVTDGDETEVTLSLFPGEYTFVVQAEFAECSSTESARMKFTVRRVQSCPAEAPQLVSPANGAANVDTEVDFVWLPVSGATQYAVLAKVNDGTETLLGKTDGTQLTRRVPPGKITWRVVAILPGCDPLRAQPFTFTVARPPGCPDRKPVLLFPTSDHGRIPSPVEFSWLGVPGAIEYRIWVPQGSPVVIATTTETHARVELPPGKYRWYAEARFPNCPSTFSAETQIIVVEALPCARPRRPEANVIGQALSGAPYQLHWTPLPNVSRYEVQESTTLDFANASSFTAAKPSMKFTHDVTGTPVQFFYRVRGVADCNDERGAYSEVVGVFVVDPKTNNASTELGTDSPIVQKVFLKGGSAPQQFSVRTDKPWLTVTPSSGTLPVEGLTLTVTADPNHLGIGTNTATLQVTYSSGAAGGPGRNDDTSISLPLSVSLVTPVTPGGKGTPPPDALIFAAVGHASGINDSLFESDIRLTNLTAQTMKYELNFTPSGVDGTTNGISSTIEVPPGVTMALDDVVASAFGSGTIGSSLGMLEVRPLPVAETGGLFGSVNDAAQQQLHTVASSRTYNFTPNGTFGQFIPATPFANFVGRGTILSLQQVAQSIAYRSNFGFLEASGQPVNLEVRVYDVANNLLRTIPLSLGAMQHRQMNGLLQNNGIDNLADGRVEVEVLSGDGKITAYVSEVDNATNDPLLVSPVVKGAIRANRYVVPGMAYLNTGSAFWVSDLRIFNAGTVATPATLTFYPLSNPSAAIAREIMIGAGEIKVLDNVLVSTFGFASNAGGSIVITTPAETALTATARTYNQTSNGTYGQFIPGVTVAESIGLNDRTLQILQVEQSTRIRTNIGVNETSGNPATVEVSLITPDSLATPVVTIPLRANEYRQFGLLEFGLADAVYNGRVTVKVVSGEGKVTAYGSAIDQITQDPTYVPAQ
jgi:Viral BACON domain